MANKSTLKSQIASAIPDNAAEEVTAASLRGAFNAVIDDYANDISQTDSSASSALSSANTAVSVSSKASKDATSAVEIATSANETAKQASKDATSAVKAVSTVSSTANDAKATAQSAQTLAKSIKETIDALLTTNASGLIDTYKEVERFLKGYTEADSLSKLLTDFEAKNIKRIEELTALTGISFDQTTGKLQATYRNLNKE